MTLISGAVGGKTDKTSVLPEFSKIERSGGASPQCYGGLTWPGCARNANLNVQVVCKNSHASYSLELFVTSSHFGHSKRLQKARKNKRVWKPH